MRPRGPQTPPAFRETRPRVPPAPGLTLVEVLLAIVLTAIILGAVVATMIQVLHLSKNSEVVLDAAANGRAAVEIISSEIKNAARVPRVTFLLGENQPSAFGDGRDNDADGRIDEELPNAYDDDGDSTTSASNDLHALLATHRERPHRVGIPDWGDIGVDEDCKFNLDRLTFRLVPSGPADYLVEEIHYEVMNFEGKSRVLVRNSRKLMLDGQTVETTAPLAYNVLSVNFLYWDPNATPQNQYWLETWDSRQTFNAPGFDLPAAVAVELTLYAHTRPIDTYVDGAPVDVLTFRTLVDVENVIQDASFPRSP